MIGIVSVGIGNIRSVSNAIYHLGYDYVLVNAVDQFDDISHLIIPGVGCYRSAMEQLAEGGFVGSIRQFAASGRPVLGICLGMQLLSEWGEEGGTTPGLALIEGGVTRLGNKNVRLPHVGWNKITFRRKSHPVLAKGKDNVDFYFVHSYHFDCQHDEAILGVTEYGQEFCSIVGKNNVIGFQFHPEKSQYNGLQLIENFCMWDGKW